MKQLGFGITRDVRERCRCPYIPEFKAMISAGKRYVNGEMHFLELRGYAVRCAQAAKLLGAPAQIFQIAEEWNRIIEIRWNEWGLVPEEQLMTEDELRAYIAAELDVVAHHVRNDA